jgi:signal transduction histidine kinase/ActR/RegA family two-component response regulator
MTEEVEQLLSLSPDLVYVYDLHADRNVFASGHWLTAVAGFPSSRSTQAVLELPSLVHPEDRALVRRHQISLKTIGKDEFVETLYRVITQGGQVRWLSSRDGVLTRDRHGNAHLAFGTARDVTDCIARYQRATETTTELQRVVDRLAAATDQAERASAAKSDLLGKLAHEVRTPLSGMVGVINLLSEMRLDPEASRLVRTLSRTGDHLLGLVNDLLDYSKGEAGMLKIVESPVDVLELLDDVSRLYEGSAFERGLDLALDIASFSESVYLLDATRVRQVMTNLLSNALKFTKTGSVTLRVGPTQRGLRFQVQDTGSGIAPDRLKSIFLDYVQESAQTERSQGGSGLGLAICLQIARSMRAELSVQSEVGKGSTFTFELPCRAVASQADAQPASLAVAPQMGSVPESFHLRVLVAEDDIANAMVAERLLSRLGCVPQIATNGQEVIDMALTGQYDLIFMDMGLPVCSGIEATTALRKNGLATPIVALTGNSSGPDREAARKAGMNAFLVKPLTLASLREVLLDLGCSALAGTLADAGSNSLQPPL